MDEPLKTQITAAAIAAGFATQDGQAASSYRLQQAGIINSGIWADWMAGRSSPNVSSLQRLLEAFGCELCVRKKSEE